MENPLSTISKDLLENFSSNRQRFYDYLHDDIVFEAPYGKSAGIPERLTGKDAVVDFIGGLEKLVEDLVFYDVQVWQSTDKNVVFSEYKGSATSLITNEAYNQIYFVRHEYKDGKIILLREFMNPINIKKALSPTS